MNKYADEVDRILDAWFGEALENAENEDRLRKHLYDPLRSLARKAYFAGYEAGEREADLPPELR